MTFFVPAYDTEQTACLEGVRKITGVHRDFDMPATFFITGKTLEANPNEYRALLDDPLFEVASHTYSHRMLRDQPYCGKAVAGEDLKIEVLRGKAIIEDVFGKPCLGLRPGCGFADGLRGAPTVLALVVEAGYEYVSSQLLGPDYTLPAPLAQPYNYVEDGYPSLWELPGHGWHDNVLKGLDGGLPRRMTLWPPALPEVVPSNVIQTPEEEVRINRVFIDRALQDNLVFVSLVWHPWSLNRFDPEMRMLRQTFEYVRMNAMQTGTYSGLSRAMRDGGYPSPGVS
jgi:peptidoglycan/xylan/chitin deacetylase (PgdA/CDA1 family)